MMENLLNASSPVIDPAQVSGQNESSSPVTVAEFDGETVLCRVCGDRASGFHYGVHACEGCKGFFRRSIQQKIQYRPCLKNQQCNIQRVNRNRCQYCRLKKCISVGMSRDAVRFGRVPKKEKARIIEQMHKKSALSQAGELSSLLANGLDVVHAVVSSHRNTCDLTQMRAAQMREHALNTQQYVSCPSNMACPLNNELGMDPNTNRSSAGSTGVDGGGGSGPITDFSESFTPAIKSVVDFAKGIPGFVLLNQDDQVTLLKAGTFEVLLVRFACLFDPQTNTMMFTGGKLYQRQASSTVTTNAGFLLDSMFDFAERFNKMYLLDEEIALFSALVLMSPDRPGLRNVEQVERIQSKLSDALQNMSTVNHREDPTLFTKLIMKRQDLRTLNTLHSEKSIARQRANHERRERQTVDDCDMDFQDSLSTRSGRSSPSLSEGSNMTMTSGYSGETGDSGSAVVGQRLPLEASSHQQVVLRTPYGTFFREEMSGFYGMMSDQPRRRCNTLDRDTLTRPRLHTIEEGNRRRYTLDRDYINKMVNRLSDRMEPRDIPPSAGPMSSSATSSPIQEEGSSGTLRGASGSTSSGYSSCGSAGGGGSFTPISLPEGSQPGGASCLQLPVTRTSPMSAGAGVNVHSTPGSPNSRSRSGSFSQQADDYLHMRPRCYSYHHNSEGRAARMSLQRRLLAAAAAATPVSTTGPGSSGSGQGSGQGEEDMTAGGHSMGKPGGSTLSASLAAAVTSGESLYMSSDMRRGSVGTAYGLHNRKPLPYMSRGAGAGGSEMGKRVVATANAVAASHGLPLMKHMMPDGTMYPLGLPPPPELPGHTTHHPHHPALWHPQAAAAAALAMGLAPPSHHAPHTLPSTHPMMQQQQRNFASPEEGITRSVSFSTPSSSSSSIFPTPGKEWESSTKPRSSKSSMVGEQQVRDLNPPSSTSKAVSPSARSPSSTFSSADAAALKAAAAAAQGNMMMSMMMIGRPPFDARNDPFIGQAFAAAAKERIGGRIANKGDGKGEAGEPHVTTSLPTSSSNRISTNLSHSASFQSQISDASSAANETESRGEMNPPVTAVSNVIKSSSPTFSSSPKLKSTSPDTSLTQGKPKPGSERSSPLGEDINSMENFGHKKFDKFRKVEKVQTLAEQQNQSSSGLSQSPGPQKPGGDVSSAAIKEETMEQDGDEGDEYDEEEEEERKLRVDLEAVKVERKSPGGEVDAVNNEDAEMSPPPGSEPLSPSPAQSPNGSGGERPKLSAKEAHPNLLAHLMNGGSSLKVSQTSSQNTPGQSPKFAPNVSPIGVSMGMPWNLSQQGLSASTSRHPLSQTLPQQLKMFKHPTFSTESPAVNSHNVAALSQSGPLVPSVSVSGSQNHHSPSLTDSQKDLASMETGQNNQRHSPFEEQDSNLFPASNSKRGEFHAATVSNLKDKILRKYDSMENLQRIAKDESSSPSPAHPALTSSQSSSALLSLASNSSSKSNSPPLPGPITGRSNSTGATEGLNKELATKLTICSLASAEASRSCSPQDSIAAAMTTRPNSVPSSSSQISEVSPTSIDASSSTPTCHQSQPGSLFTAGLPHPASALSQIPQMLMSQGIHPANLPMYHSMLARGFPSSSSSSSASFTPGRTSEHVPHNAPLASMQRFADFFNRGQIMEPGEKR